MSQVTVVATMKARPGQEEIAHRELLNLVEKTRPEAGCINYDLHRGIEDTSVFLFYENWESMAALEAHWATPHLVHLKSVGGDLFVAPSDVKLFTMASSPAKLPVK